MTVIQGIPPDNFMFASVATLGIHIQPGKKKNDFCSRIKSSSLYLQMS